MLGMTLPSGRTVTWTYDTANRIYTAGGTPPGGMAKTYVSSVLYASQGGISQINLGNGPLGQGLVEWRTYDALRQQLTGINLGTSNTDSSKLALGFAYCAGTPPCANNNGNLQSQTISPLGVTQTYTYDGYNRLYTSGEKAGTTTIWSEDFNYDSFGNRWVPSVFMGLSNPVGIPLSPYTPVAASSYNTPSLGYNANNRNYYNNNFGYDNAGNQTTISPFAVSYDVEGRQAGFTSTSNGSASYTYDGDGRRVAKTAGGVTTTYVYDATGNLAAEYSTQPPSMPCQTCYLTTDHLGSTRLITDQNGKPVSRHDFLPFGEELATSNRTAALDYGVTDNVMHRYTGQQRDLEGPGLDFFHARYFSGAQGRFTGPDRMVLDAPRLLDPQQWNLYVYGRGGPFKYVDPDGRALVHVEFLNSAGSQGEGYLDARAAGAFGRLNAAAGELPAAGGGTLDFRVNNTLRTTAEQQQLWERRAANPNPVAQPGTSRHESGLAFDFDIRRVIQQGMTLADFRRFASQFGFGPIPGGGDPVHLEYALGLKRNEYLDLISLNQANYRLMQTALSSFGGDWGTAAGRDYLVNNWGFGACAEDPWRCAISEAILKTGTWNLVDQAR
jgi:RHS repeat-associated protein